MVSMVREPAVQAGPEQEHQEHHGLRLYEGKAKRVSLRPDGMVEIHYKDDATAFNAQKHALFAGKGVLCSCITECLFRELLARGIPSHHRGRLDARTLLAVRCDIVPLEV